MNQHSRKTRTIYPWLLIILLASAGLRLFRLDFADGRSIFDERNYYIDAARSYLENRDDPNPQHPPLGKELIALGIAMFGNNPYGWRVPSLVFSLLGIGLVFVLAHDVFGGTFVPLVSAFLLSADTMYFVYSRLAVMDMFLTVFVLLTLIFLWRCYKRGGAKNLLLLSVSFGLAIATKWTALSLAPVTLVFLFLRYRLGRKFFGVLGLLGLLGGSIYVASYAPYLLRHSFWDVLGIQRSMVTIWENYERTKTVRYPELHDSYFLNHAYSWIFDPMTAYFGEPTPDMKLKAILVRFNPVVFWGGLGILGWEIWKFRKFGGSGGKGWRQHDRILFLVLPVLCNFLPWLFLRRVQYLYYFLPSFPLMIILTAEALRHLLNEHKEVVPMFLIAAAVMFCYDFPLLVGLPTNPRLLNPLATGPIQLRLFENSTSIRVLTLP